jgi:hypothetical protein
MRSPSRIEVEDRVIQEAAQAPAPDHIRAAQAAATIFFPPISIPAGFLWKANLYGGTRGWKARKRD